MLPKEVLYAFYSPFRVFLSFLLGYIFGIMHIGFKSGLVKLIIFLAVLFVLEVTLRILAAKLRERKRKKRYRIPPQYYWGVDEDERW